MRILFHGLLLILSLLALGACSDMPYRGASFHPDTYQVRRGETLYSIAWKFGLNYHSLARWNGIAPPYTIYPGQRLRMNPPPGSRPLVAQRAMPAQTRPAVPQRRVAASTQPNNTLPPVRSSPSLASTRAARHMTWIWPAQGTVCAGFSRGPTGNQGIDICGRAGEPVVAAIGGQVVYSGDGLPSYGNLLIIQHNTSIITAYAHNRKLLVHEGQLVKQGQKIAIMGLTGTGVTKPTLHFEIRIDGNPVNPMRYLPGKK